MSRSLLPNGPSQRKVVDALIRKPNQNAATISAVTGTAYGSVYSALAILLARGTIARSKIRGSHTYHVTPAALAQMGNPTIDAPIVSGPAKELSVEAPTVPQPSASRKVELVPPKTEGLSELVDWFVDALANDVVARLKPVIVARLSEFVVSATEEISARSIPTVVRNKLKRILVCGCKSDQGAILQREFQGVADIRFVTVADNDGLWKSNAANADAVVVMADFVGHKHTKSLESIGVRHIDVHGGMTSIKDKLLELSVA